MDWIIGVPIVLGVAYFLVVGVILVVKELAPFTYGAFRWERKGICPDCKLPYVSKQERLANDQTYGAGTTWRNVCPNGHLGMVHGNRRFADWGG